MRAMDLKSIIRTIPDYPKPGIQFRDVTSLMGQGEAFAFAIEAIAAAYKDARVDKVAGIEARGFIFGAPVAVALGAGFVPLRKPGKLPYASLSEPYALEYGRDELHMHVDAIAPGERVLLIDDLIATGGTMEAALKLMRRAGAEMIAAAFVVDLPELGGRARLNALGLETMTLVEFDGH
jgi:adenine phosphoribosyltransferase